MTQLELAGELARLEGVQYQFDNLVRQIVDGNRQAAMQRIVGKLGGTPSSVTKEVETLDRALEKIEHNLRGQYDEFLSAYISIRAERLSMQDLERFVSTLSEEGVQTYFERTRSLQEETKSAMGEVVGRIVKRAATVGGG